MPCRRLPVREAELFKSLGHLVWLQILWILAKEEARVCHLEARFRMRQACQPQQLAVLREAGRIAERRMRPYVYYPARGPQVGELIDVVRRFAGGASLGVHDPVGLLGPTLRRPGSTSGRGGTATEPRGFRRAQGQSVTRIATQVVIRLVRRGSPKHTRLAPRA